MCWRKNSLLKIQVFADNEKFYMSRLLHEKLSFKISQVTKNFGEDLSEILKRICNRYLGFVPITLTFTEIFWQPGSVYLRDVPVVTYLLLKKYASAWALSNQNPLTLFYFFIF